MQTETTQQKSHEEHRIARAEAMADIIVGYSKKSGVPVDELLAKADSRDWHLFARLSGGGPKYNPSEETKELVRRFVNRDSRVQDHEKPHTQDSDCTVDPETGSCRSCGVLHGEPCPACAGHGFHLPTCTELVGESEVH